MKRSLKLKKIKISKLNNVLAGAIPAQANQQTIVVTYPITYTLDTKFDDSCQEHTNDNNNGRTGIAVRSNDVQD